MPDLTPDGSTVRDAIAAADVHAGVDRLLAHPGENEAAAKHVRALIQTADYRGTP